MRPGWEQLDALLSQYMTPAMTEAGFARDGWRYLLESAERNVMLVEVLGSAPIPELTFYIEWAAIPRVLREFHGGRKSGRWPRGEWGIVSTRLKAGPQMKSLPDIPEAVRDEFTVAPEPGLEDRYIGGWDLAFLAAERAKLLDFDSFGARLDRLLREEAIPLWRRMLDRDFLAHPDWADFFLGGRTGIREAILYVDDGEPTQVAAWLDQAALAATPPPDPPPVDPTLVEWLRRRLAARTRER